MSRERGVRFADFVRGWNDLVGFATPAHHIWIAEWLERVVEREKRGLLLAFRASGKSTIVAIFIVWLLLRDQNLRALVVAADERLAKKMVRSVKRIIELHPETRGLVPKNKIEWGSGSFTIERPNPTLRDPSVMAIGLGGNITGSRADVIICDDVEVPRNSDTSAKREELREKLLELQFVLTPEGAQIFIGTPHAEKSIYKV